MKRFSGPELHRLTRDTGVIARIALLVGAVSVIIAYFCSHLPKDSPENADAAAQIQAFATGDQSIDPGTVLEGLRRALITLSPPVETGNLEALRRRVIEKHIADPQLRRLFMAYCEAALTGEREAILWLEAKAKGDPPARFANEMLGDLSAWRGDAVAALKYYQAEAEFPEAVYARSQVINHLIETKDRPALVSLLKDPRYRLDHHQPWLELGVIMRDPGFILRGVFLHDYAKLPLITWCTTLLVTVVWFWILTKILFVPSWRSRAVLYGVLGLMLGVLSTTFTLFAVVWQESIWGLEENGEWINDFLVNVMGVGMREETIKLLFLLPLVPWLYRSRDPKTILLATSCIGLGFAVQENIGYFGSTFARFVTANFFHIVLSGTLGFAFCRFLYTPGKEWNRFLATYILVVIVHGSYDFLLGIGQDGGIFAIILFCLSAYFYFDLVEKHCTANRQVISPMAVFVVGCSLIFGCTLIAVAVVVPSFRDTVSSSGYQFLATVPLMFLYINRFREA